MMNKKTVSYMVTIFVLASISYSCAPKTQQADVIQVQEKTPETAEETVVKEKVTGKEVESVTEAVGDFEPFPVFKASEILPPELLKSEYYEVVEEVQSDCFWNRYKINTPFGEFEAINTPLLKTRLHEIQAIAELKEISGVEAVASGVLDSAIEPFEAAIYVAQRPIETVIGLPGGIISFFKKIFYSVGTAVSTTGKIAEEGVGAETEGDVNYLIDWYLGTTNVERQVAKSVGVDPYTSNPVLAEEIKRVAKYKRFGKVGATFVPGVAALAMIKRVREYVWNKDPEELRDYNKKELSDMGISEEVIDKFFQSPYYSPTYQTAIVLGLKELANVDNRESLIKQATFATSIPEAQFLVATLLLTVWFSNNQTRIVAFLEDVEAPTIVTEDNRIVTIFAVDYLCWSREFADAARNHAEALKNFDFDKKEVWIVGEVSDKTKEELSKLGFEVHNEKFGVSGEMTGTERERAASDINTQIYNIIAIPEE